MYKVLIVDDEPSIRQGLRTLIDWSRFGFEVCGEAANGKEGLLQYAEYHPDLMLVDIRMPGMDGLDMIEEARKMGLPCRFMVLTGYSEFQYAKRALHQGVECYLLKPIDAAELELQAGRVQRELASDRMMREQATEGVVRRTERLLQTLLTGSGAEEGVSAYRELAVKFGFPWKSYRVLLVEIEPKPESAAVIREGKEFIRSELELRGLGYVCEMNEYAAVLLNDMFIGSVKTVMETICKQFMIRWEHRILVYTGRAVIDGSKIGLSYDSAQGQARSKFLLHTETGLWLGHSGNRAEAADGADLRIIDSEKMTERLAMAVDSGHADVLRKTGEEAIHLIVRESSLEPSIKMRTAMLYLSVIHRLHSVIGGMDRMTEFRKVPSEWNECRSLEGLRQAFLGRLYELSATLNQDRPGAALYRMIDFIRRYSDKDLKLETLAEMYHYNSGYLGKMFRQQTGQYFNTYLDRIRIENAKELLKQGLKVHQVAVKVGYANVDYFHGKFKKYVGMPPSVFRENNR